MTKVCAGCGETKPLDGFNVDRRGPGGRSSRCKTCRNLYLRERWRNDPAYRERKRAYNAAWNEAHPYDEGKYQRYRDSILRRLYSLTQEQYEQMADAQGGVCAICSGPPEKRSLIVDHDHSCCPDEKSCGRCVRGLLCTKCNVGLGNFRDRPELLLKAADYLRSAA